MWLIICIYHSMSMLYYIIRSVRFPSIICPFGSDKYSLQVSSSHLAAHLLTYAYIAFMLWKNVLIFHVVLLVTFTWQRIRVTVLLGLWRTKQRVQISMIVCYYLAALWLKITAPTSKVHTNALPVMRDFCCTKIQWKKEDVLVCM